MRIIKESKRFIKDDLLNTIYDKILSYDFPINVMLKRNLWWDVYTKERKTRPSFLRG